MDNDQSTSSKPIQFSLGLMLMIVTIACMTTALFIMSSRLNSVERELKSLQPMSVREVAKQFQESTSFAGMSTNVKDVRYSQEKDSYHVKFSFTYSADPKKQEWHTDIILKSDSYGGYFGKIRSPQFYQPLGYQDGYRVLVRPPSAL